MESKTVHKIISLLKLNYKFPKPTLNYKNLYQLLISVILSAQTTDNQVNKINKILFKKYKNFFELAKAKKADLQKIIKPLGYYKQKSDYIIKTAKKIVKDYNGEVPSKMEDLLNLKGVGRKTANIVLYFGFKKSVGIAVDTHCKRVSYRLGLVNSQNPIKIEKELLVLIPKKYWGVYTNWMIKHGRAVCLARKPKCFSCFLKNLCKYNLKNNKN